MYEETDEDLYNFAYGLRYEEAKQAMQLLDDEIKERSGKGFSTEKECKAWANDHLLDIIVLSKSQQGFLYLTHKGEPLKLTAWKLMYKNVLFINHYDSEREATIRIPWFPQEYCLFEKAKIYGERGDLGRLPILSRNYFLPECYYNNGTFNHVKPFPCFAKETGKDTSYLYTYLQAIAGECYMHLLAWLRTKLLRPLQKTQIVPIIVSKAQGTGKTTFVEVICKALFGKDNVIVTSFDDSSSRFNADSADALILCYEEREYDEKHNSSSLKSKVTMTTIRKEAKGYDPYYQDSYTDYVITSNNDVPLKFEENTDQRRYMVMEADETFTRKNSKIADEIFTKLYGYDANNVKVCKSFTEDIATIEQLKHELISSVAVKKTELRNFPHTAAYRRCFTMPRTYEVVKIETMLRGLAPFIAASLRAGTEIMSVKYENEILELKDILNMPEAFQYTKSKTDRFPYIALCKPIVFGSAIGLEQQYRPSVVERALGNCNEWMQEEFGLHINLPSEAINNGFKLIRGLHKHSTAVKITTCENYFATKESIRNKYKPFGVEVEVETEDKNKTAVKTEIELELERKNAKRLRVNSSWKPDPNGEFETVNKLKAGTITLKDKSNNVASMDCFLFESDSSTYLQRLEEKMIISKLQGEQKVISAEDLFKNRLEAQKKLARRLFGHGYVARVVYSGGKSYHLLVRVANEPKTLEEYKWLHAYLAEFFSKEDPDVEFDPSTADPARLTRAPITFERVFEYKGVIVKGVQKMISTNWNNLCKINWRKAYKKWLDKPMDDFEKKVRKKLRPCKVEYKEAMLALLQGTFWTDDKWNGLRQDCFFSAYRLCRDIGYSHKLLWSKNGILDGIDKYYKQNEVLYWKSREHCDLIKSIDKDYD